MNLFKINEEIEKCIIYNDDEVINIETGEILDISYLNNLKMQRDEKIENIAKWIKNLDSDIQQLKAQKDLFAQRQKVAENKRDSLKRYLSTFLENTKWEAKDKSVAISFRKSEAVKIINEAIIPKKWFIKQDPKLDKVGIKEQLKLGKKIKGTELEIKQNIQVK